MLVLPEMRRRYPSVAVRGSAGREVCGEAKGDRRGPVCPTVLLVADQDPPKDAPGGGDDTWKTYSPPVSQPVPETPPVSEAPPSLPPTHVPYGSKVSSSSYSGTYPPAAGSSIDTVLSSDLVSSSKKGCGIVGLVVAAAVFIPLIIGVIIAVKAISGGWDELQDGMGDPFSVGDKPDMHSVDGWEGMIDALKEETGGSTTVFDAVVYPEYAVITVPVDTTSKRYYSFYYDGDLRKTSQGTTEDLRFDIATIDANVLARLIERAKTELVEDPDPTRIYAIIGAPTEFAKGAWFSVYASNAFSETGYFTADKTGKIVSKTVSP